MNSRARTDTTDVPAGGRRILALGVTRINDSYPNVKYKLAALGRIFADCYVDAVVPIDSETEFAAVLPDSKSGKLALSWKLLLGHLKSFYRSATNRADAVYVCYPGIVIAAWLGLPFIRSRYRAVYLDAFISLYDTTVRDRGLFSPGSLAAKALFALERRALRVATTVIVDTPENADYYTALFNLPATRFRAMPLSIPPFSPAGSSPDETTGPRLRCVFVGTFVPLQGIPVIVEALKLLVRETDIEFVFVGDGQDANFLEEYIASCAAGNVTWHRGHFSTEFVVEQIRGADVCLGVFGAGEKTQRVLPYKLYYYLALAMPVVTASGATTTRILADCTRSGGAAPLAVVPAGDPHSLARTLLRFRDDPAEFTGLGSAGEAYFRRALSDSVIERALTELLEASGAGG